MSEVDDSAMWKAGRQFRLASAASYGYALFIIFTMVGTIIMQKLQPG